jgi:protein translocase SecG subunit
MLTIAHITVSILLIILILLQERSVGLSGLMGGESTFYQTRRGLEKIIFGGTIVLAVIFVALALAKLIF